MNRYKNETSVPSELCFGIAGVLQASPQNEPCLGRVEPGRTFHSEMEVESTPQFVLDHSDVPV